LKRLAGLLIYASTTHWAGQPGSPGGTTAQSEVTVRKGLDWLAAHGDIVIVSEEKDQLKLAPGSNTKTNELERASDALQALLRKVPHTAFISTKP